MRKEPKKLFILSQRSQLYAMQVRNPTLSCSFISDELMIWHLCVHWFYATSIFAYGQTSSGSTCRVIPLFQLQYMLGFLMIRGKLFLLITWNQLSSSFFRSVVFNFVHFPFNFKHKRIVVFAACTICFQPILCCIYTIFSCQHVKVCCAHVFYVLFPCCTLFLLSCTCLTYQDSPKLNHRINRMFIGFLCLHNVQRMFP